MGMGEGITLVISMSNTYIPNRTFFISEFTSKVFAIQTSLPFSLVSIEEDWNF